MVKYNTIVKSISSYLKHHEYPKADAIRYYNENKRKFRKETWDEGIDHKDKSNSPPGHLFLQQDELQKQVEYEGKELDLLSGYSTGDFRVLSYYHYNRTEDLREEMSFYNILKPHIPSYGGEWIEEGVPYGKWLELEMKARQSFANDPNPDNWFYDSGWSRMDDELRNKIVNSLESPENMTPQDWQRIYKENGLDPNWTMKDWSDTMSGMIEKSPRIQSDCIAWRYGEIPVNPDGRIPDVGEEGEFKGFTGLTYNEQLTKKGGFLYGAVGDRWGEKDKRYRLKVIVPHGTQGMVLGDSVNTSSWQNELLLNKNQKFVVMEKNDNKSPPTATILLY